LTYPFEAVAGNEDGFDMCEPLSNVAKSRKASTGTPKIRVKFLLNRLKESEVPVPLKSKTGGSVESFYNSITRTEIKKALREGDRGGAETVAFVEVAVLEAENLPPSSLNEAYFFINVNSSDKKKYKSKHAKDRNPKVSTDD